MDKLTTHGSMFWFFRDFLNGFQQDCWARVQDAAGVEGRIYEMHESYPYAEFEAILLKSSAFTRLPVHELEEQFGEALVPPLLAMYGKFVDPRWKTFDLLLYTEIVMHKAVRREETKAAPPVLNVSRVHDKLLIIDYYSKRKMASLAVGIIKGIAKHYKESDQVKVVPTTEPQEERVQIRVEFL